MFCFIFSIWEWHAQLWFVCAGAIEQRRAVRGEITNKETTFSFAPAPPGWPPAKFSREGWLTPSPPLLPLFFLFQTHIRTPLQPSKATGEKKEERQKQKSNSCNFLERAQLGEATEDAKRVGFADGSHGYARELILFFPKKKTGGRTHVFVFFPPPYETSKVSLCVNKAGAFELELKPSACD